VRGEEGNVSKMGIVASTNGNLHPESEGGRTVSQMGIKLQAQMEAYSLRVRCGRRQCEQDGIEPGWSLTP